MLSNVLNQYCIPNKTDIEKAFYLFVYITESRKQICCETSIFFFDMSICRNE